MCFYPIIHDTTTFSQKKKFTFHSASLFCLSSQKLLCEQSHPHSHGPPEQDLKEKGMEKKQLTAQSQGRWVAMDWASLDSWRLLCLGRPTLWRWDSDPQSVAHWMKKASCPHRAQSFGWIAMLLKAATLFVSAPCVLPVCSAPLERPNLQLLW